MADSDSPSNHMSSSVDGVQQQSATTASATNHQEQHQESTNNDWPW